MRWCLDEAGLRPEDLDAVAYSFDPALAKPAEDMGLDDPWDHLRVTYAERAPGFLATALPGLDREQVRFVPHHVAHAASAALAAPIEAPGRPCSVLVLDGRGEQATHLAGRYEGGRLEVLAAPGAAALAGPALRVAHRAPRVPAVQRRVQGDGAGLLRQAASSSTSCARRSAPPATAGSAPSCPTGRAAPRRVGGEDDWAGAHADLACSVQARLEEVLVELARWLHEQHRRPGADHGRRHRAELRREQPDLAGDALRGGLGAAGGRRRRHRPGCGPAGRAPSDGASAEPMTAAALGPAWTRRRARRLAAAGGRAVHDAGGPRRRGRRRPGRQRRRRLVRRAQRVRPARPRPPLPAGAPGPGREPRAAQRRQGPRAVPPGRADGAARAGRGDLPDGPLPSPYMLFVHRVAPAWRDRIPAVVHVDGTARIQTVDDATTAAGGGDAARPSRRAPACRWWSTPASTPRAGRWWTTRGTRWSCFGSAPVDALVLGPHLVRRAGLFAGT